tara:strand:+ start:929 stop:1525 length:597 start_codon:yes stop_codon:yes gene_type:complete
MSEQAKRLETFLARTDIKPSERSFGDSLKSWYDKKGRLSQGQWSAFQRMEARYNPEVIALRQSWYDSWDETKASHMLIAANYYRANPPYFGDLATKVIEDKSFIPSEKAYRKMVENKYVQKVIATVNATPQFDIGTLVQVRRTASKGAYKLRDRVAMVVANDGPVRTAAKGARTYTVLPFGESQTVQIEERYLKKKRG